MTKVTQSRLEDTGEQTEASVETSSDNKAPAERLIVALDIADEERARTLVQELDPLVNFYKIGYTLFLHAGWQFVRELTEEGKRVFLDLKFFDVPETVERAVERVAELGVDFVTVHGNGANIEAARRAKEGTHLKILAVTLLTSLSSEDLKQLYGSPVDTEQHVLKVAKHLVERGCDGVIASPKEIGGLRGELGGGILIVTPGVRRSGETVHDHKRWGSPSKAIRDGADYIVVGRPIYQAKNPRAVAKGYIEEIRGGL